jgi:hypothetical protein
MQIPEGSRTVCIAAVMVMTALVAYAAYMALLLSIDTIWGDGQLLYQYESESRVKLARQLVSDGLHAAPVFILAYLLIYAEMKLIARFTMRPGGVLPAALAGIGTGIALSAIFVGLTPGAILPPVAAGLVMSLALKSIIQPVRQQT